MGKFKYVEEFEINASPKILFPYLDTASGLQDWFCPSVTETDDNIFVFNWDGQPQYARKIQQRQNKCVRYNFLDDDKQETENPSYVEFQIETSELTRGQFLRVIDFSDEGDEKELREMWQNMIYDLRAIIGG